MPAMLRSILFRVVVPVVCSTASLAGADRWAELKPGMTRGEAAALLGGELMASRSRGFEVAIYDQKAEVVYLRGQVVAWTAPASSSAAASPGEAWHFEQTRSSTPSPAPAANAARAPELNRRAILPAYRIR